jgi:hypothetical protein
MTEFEFYTAILKAIATTGMAIFLLRLSYLCGYDKGTLDEKEKRLREFIEQEYGDESS